jgi:cation diffusion facilitator family transporter
MTRHQESLRRLRHDHRFHTPSGRARRRTLQVVILSALMMVGEIVAGAWTGSMALLADGWHMATHVAAFGITLFAYSFAERHADDPRFSFGTGKVGVLGGFASAVALAAAALMMAVESILRLVEPVPIHTGEALVVAALGLVVNLVAGWMLHTAGGHAGHDHATDHDQDQDHHRDRDRYRDRDRNSHPEHEHECEHEHAHAHEHEHGIDYDYDHDYDTDPDSDPVHGHGHGHGHDHNLRAATLHVAADALTSLLAIAALLLARGQGCLWLDAAMGLVGAGLILHWSRGLLRETGEILLDGGVPARRHEEIRARVEADGDSRLADMHVWWLGPGRLSAVLSVVADQARPPEDYKRRLAGLPDLVHVVVEVNACRDGDCHP